MQVKEMWGVSCVCHGVRTVRIRAQTPDLI